MTLMGWTVLIFLALPALFERGSSWLPKAGESLLKMYLGEAGGRSLSALAIPSRSRRYWIDSQALLTLASGDPWSM